MEKKIKKILWILYFFSVLFFYVWVIKLKPQLFLSYSFFTIIFNYLFIYGFREKRIFFDTFLGLYLWLGFWLKFSVRMTIGKETFVDPVGQFNFSFVSFDKALYVSSFAAAAVLIASLVREKVFYNFDSIKSVNNIHNFEIFYFKFRKRIIPLFIVTILLIAFSNVLLGVYQRGMTSKINLPFKLNGLYTWLLFFGLSSFSSVICYYELKKNKTPWVGIILGLFECFTSNISMLSRGFILNANALILGLNSQINKQLANTKFNFKAIIVCIYFLLFIISVYSVNLLRSTSFVKSVGFGNQIEFATQNTKALFIDRWVGIQGVFSISSHDRPSYALLNKALNEKYQDVGTSFYDREIATDSPFSKKELVNNHFISIPGAIAFFFYPGSIFFLIIAIFIFCLICSLFEYFAFKFTSGNLIFCSIIGQVIAYRFIHFGYVPKQSYLLYGTVLVNISLLVLFDILLGLKNRIINK